MNLIFKSVFQPAYCSYRLLQFQLPSISSHRYKSVGVQKKIRVVPNKNKFDTPMSLLLDELEEETDYTIPLTPEHIQDQFEFRKLEMKKMQSKQYLKSIEYKYFREYRQAIRREPNLMTWAMKEHMVNLHMLDPDTWNVETLSYAFPASRFRVSEILKSKLNTPSEEKVKKHDETVLKNWKTLTKGKFGSIGLLKKLISGRIAKVGGETLPAAPIDVAQKTKDLIFTPTGDVYVYLLNTEIWKYKELRGSDTKNDGGIKKGKNESCKFVSLLGLMGRLKFLGRRKGTSINTSGNEEILLV
ncbi:hypothetical protein Anas_02759 [Armadillidium nasatum]|uniref:Uncharacterized protein n=1 Tax=Armadillidium nasatum TaxID=96803 RepID=A0A5N5TPQ1_9CRUS|nr:hypothetical protein Anas_02759 [Armadillidium nasatum]